MLAAFPGAGLGLAPRKLWNYFWSPKEIQHPFHPDHTLFLLDKPPYESGSFQCKACGWVFSGSTYHCSECSFDLDPTCASLKPTEKTQQHLSPPHPLIFCELNDEDKNKFEGRTCCSCNQPFKDSCSICVCLHCHCLLDESCANLPLQIQHPFHPQYPLNLLFQPLHQEDKDSIKWHCRACGKKLKGSGGLIYQCCTSTCDSCEGKFGLDVFCASLTPTYELDLSLAHPLTLCETKKNKNSFSCYACQLPFRDSVYVCLECCILLHITCANLPREINDQDCHIHLLTLHPLNLLQSSNRPCPINQFDCCFHCNACKKDTIGFAYTCGECEFYSDIRCVMKSAVLYKRQ